MYGAPRKKMIADDRTVDELRSTIRDLEQKLDDQTRWIRDMSAEIAIINAQNSSIDEFIIESLRAGAHSQGFHIMIQNCSRKFLKDLNVDLSKYLSYDSPIFDIIMDAGYDPRRLCDLDRAVQNVFTFNYCLPCMPMWKIMSARILKLARNPNVMNVSWDASVRIFDAACSHSRDYIAGHPDSAAWIPIAKELRSAMVAARVIQVD